MRFGDVYEKTPIDQMEPVQETASVPRENAPVVEMTPDEMSAPVDEASRDTTPPADDAPSPERMAEILRLFGSSRRG
jgi:hypothetical protein